MTSAPISARVGTLTNIPEELRARQQEQLVAGPAAPAPNALLPGDTVSMSSQAHARSRNLMAGNFAQERDSGNSYADVLLHAINSQRSLENSIRSSLASSLESVVGQAVVRYGDSALRTTKLMKDTTEAHQDVLDELTGNVEARTAEAMAPTDENGEPVEQLAGPAASRKAPDTAPFAPAPEVSLGGVARAATALSSLSVDS